MKDSCFQKCKVLMKWIFIKPALFYFDLKSVIAVPRCSTQQHAENWPGFNIAVFFISSSYCVVSSNEL